MHANLRRFVLLSAAVHVGVLAVLSGSPIRPPLIPMALTVSLNEAPPSAMAAGNRHLSKPAVASAAPVPEPSSIEPPSSVAMRQEAPQQAPSSKPTPAGAAGTHKETSPDIAALSPDEGSVVRDVATATSPASGASSRQGPIEKNLADITSAQSQDTPMQQSTTGQLGSQLEGQLREAIAPHFVYPLLARRQGWQGEVQIGLRVEADGRLSHLHIARSSGYRLLDRAALAALGGIANLPGAAGWLEGQHFDMVLPIEYRLIDGQS